MSGRVRVTLPDGRRVTGFRKTLRQNPKRAPAPRCELPFRLRFILPAALAGTVSPGPTGVIGVSVGELHQVEAEGMGLEWVCKQASEFLGRVASGVDLELPFTIERGAYKASAKLIYVPGASVVFPCRVKKALVFAVK